MANDIKITFAGDSKQLERAFDSAGSSAKEFGNDLETAEKEAGRFSRGVGSMNDTVGASESKFMGAADLADGLATTLGINVGPTIEYARGFADMAGGFNNLVGPAMESLSTKIGKMTFVTKIQTAAQTALNAVMRANPIGLVITAIAVLTGAFILAYKKSETFRNIVHGAMAGVRAAVDWTKDTVVNFGKKVGEVVTDSARVIGKIADIITTPYQLAFKAIARLWNSTVGGFSIPSIGFGPFKTPGFTVPNIPELAAGGIAHGGRAHIVGERGPELFIPGQTGRVIPNAAMGGGANVTVVISTGASDLDELIRKRVRILGAGNVQKAFGNA